MDASLFLVSLANWLLTLDTECWNSPYSTASFPQYAEVITPDLKDAPSIRMLVETAKALGIYLIGGEGGCNFDICDGCSEPGWVFVRVYE